MQADRHVASRAVREVMTPEPITVSPEATLASLKRLFDRHDFNAFPVVDGQGVLLGLVTKLDLLRAFQPDARRLIPDLRTVWAQRVGGLMSRGVVSVEPDEPVAAAIETMVQWRLRSVPVVERSGGKPVLVGMVSRSDVLGCLILGEPGEG